MIFLTPFIICLYSWNYEKKHKIFTWTFFRLSNESSSTISLQPTDKEEIANAISCLNSSKVSGPNSIPYQAFIQALLSKAIFHQRFSFLTVCLIKYLHEVLPWWAPKGKYLKFGSPDCCKIHFWHSFWLQKRNLHIVCSSSDFSWNFRVSWGVLWDWVL